MKSLFDRIILLSILIPLGIMGCSSKPSEVAPASSTGVTLKSGSASAIASASGFTPWNYTSEDGPHAVDVKIPVLRDESRHRDIPLKLYIPKEDGKYPIVIFSHGTGASKDSYSYIGNFLATHGFVVIHPSHLGSDSGILRVGHPFANIARIKKATMDPKNWKDRPLDVKFVISHLDEIAERIPSLSLKWDPKKIAVGGHSFGAYTTLALAGAPVQLPGGEKTFEDEHIKAFFAISPQGQGAIFNEKAWDKLKSPILIVTGSKDRGIDGQNAQWRMDAYNGIPPGDKYLLYIDNATHLSFADPFGSGNDVPYVRESVKATLWAFLDFYLNGKDGGKNFLLSDSLQKSTQGAAKLQHK